MSLSAPQPKTAHPAVAKMLVEALPAENDPVEKMFSNRHKHTRQMSVDTLAYIATLALAGVPDEVGVAAIVSAYEPHNIAKDINNQFKQKQSKETMRMRLRQKAERKAKAKTEELNEDGVRPEDALWEALIERLRPLLTPEDLAEMTEAVENDHPSQYGVVARLARKHGLPVPGQ